MKLIHKEDVAVDILIKINVSVKRLAERMDVAIKAKNITIDHILKIVFEAIYLIALLSALSIIHEEIKNELARIPECKPQLLITDGREKINQ